MKVWYGVLIFYFLFSFSFSFIYYCEFEVWFLIC